MRLAIGATEHDLTSRALVMGIVNVSPESSVASPTVTEALARARLLVREGADIIDIGAVSGRAPTISVDEEVGRLLPALEVIRANVRVPISVDTSRAEVLAVALAAGAWIANDVSGFADEDYLDIAAKVDATVVATDALDVPSGDAVGTVCARLEALVSRAQAAGIGANRIVVDAGLGVGKSDADSLALLRGTDQLASLGRPLLVAASRKEFIGAGLGQPAAELLGGACGAVALAVWGGARIVRTHDVRQARRVADVVAAIVDAT